MTFAARSTSWRVRSLPPEMLTTTPEARARGNSSNGEATAISAASWARDFPDETPTPNSAEPASSRTDRTSAKSTFTRPGMVMMSEMPWTPWRRTSSARRKASWTGVESETSFISLSFEITMIASTCIRRFSRASVACLIRLRPSKEKGKVTIPTVSFPISFERRAMTGAAPLPVPPPIPAVRNTRSAPSRAAEICSLLSSADFKPIEGSPPQPSPRVSLEPIWSRLGDLDVMSAWASVLMTQKSTPVSSDATIRFTALPPPPPTPSTRIFTLSDRTPRASGWPDGSTS
mmetsp:Transcript_15285/g.26205  ORF Transcript_15285/g.26205 Transcript_15285/m.26205 type:complete len:289 (+) Transcript_15285:280-1146(+)